MPVTLSISALVKTPPSGRLLMEEALSTTVSGGNVVRCIDPEFKHQESFSFSKVFTDNDEYINTAYSSQIYPLVQRTIDGESTSVILSGPLSADTTTSHVLSSAGGKGLLSSAASDLISAAHRGGNSGAVTFSWLKIDSSPSEGLADILKSASATPAVAKTPTTSMVNSMGSYSTGTNSISGSVQSSGDMSLLVREIGKGRGMFVPGLWEVEIANGSDVDAVVSHVIQAVKNADHAKGGHTVFSLTYKPAHLRGGSALKTPSSASKSGSYQLAGSSSDPPGLGRITFIILASPGSTAHPPSIAASAAASPSTAPIPAYTTPSSTPWFAHLQSTLQWISQKRPSPPFHKSRVTLMLRDVLCSRQHAAWILLLPATAAALDANYAWLRLCAILSGGTSTTSLFTSTNGVKSVSYGTTFALDAARSRGSQGWSSPSPPSPMSLPRPQPIAATENEQVLAIQLASARQELDRVTIALATVQEELAATQRAYRELGAAMETTGSTLKKRDVEALHKAQADLKDYDVYRQVMEAALVRMQSELEVINSENKALRESSRTSTATRSSLKQQEEDKRAALKGYSNTKKALADAQDRLSEKDVLLKKVTKERDSLRTSLLVAHHSADSLKAKEEEISGLKKEIVDAKKRASHSASVERGYRLELDEVLVGHRNAISKVIELQKENAALHEMLESAGGSMRRVRV